MEKTAKFAMLIAKSATSNAVTIARSIKGYHQLVAAGYGEPNRIDALTKLALPRAAKKFPQASLG